MSRGKYRDGRLLGIFIIIFIIIIIIIIITIKVNLRNVLEGGETRKNEKIMNKRGWKMEMVSYHKIIITEFSSQALRKTKQSQSIPWEKVPFGMAIQKKENY